MHPKYNAEKTPDELKSELVEPKEKENGGEEAVEPGFDEESYKWVRSSSSCNIKDIQGIIFGGHSSRFWVYRKYFMSFD
jgi:hypothetical protein